jgi:hypothetical protein
LKNCKCAKIFRIIKKIKQVFFSFRGISHKHKYLQGIHLI